MDANEVESLLVACILDKTIQGKIDQVQQILELDTTLQGSERYGTTYISLTSHVFKVIGYVQHIFYFFIHYIIAVTWYMHVFRYLFIQCILFNCVYRYDSIDHWSAHVNALHTAVVGRMV